MGKRASRWSLLFLAGLAILLVATAGLLLARRRAYRQLERACSTPLTGDADWQGDWDLSERGADPSQAGSLAGSDRVIIPFDGTALALQVRRGNYRGYLWVQIDGEPANRLPRTERGAYLVLSSPDYEPEVTSIIVSSNLAAGPHVAEITADRGWAQWPLVGWRVERGPNTSAYDRALAALVAGAVVCLVGAIACGARWLSRRRVPKHSGWPTETSRRKVGQGRLVASIDDLLGSRVASLMALLAALTVFYLSPWATVTWLSGAAMAVLIAARLDLGLALVALSAPFYLHPRPLLGKSFALSEILILLCLASWTLRKVKAGNAIVVGRTPSFADLTVLSLVLVAAASTVFAAQQHVALRELRVVILEPALLYLMVRTTKLSEGSVWRIVDGLVAGAAVVALIGLVQYASGTNIITAEQGFRRLRSVYGSPNNAALYLGRVLPILLAVSAFAATDRRRLAYGLLVVPMALALLLTFSRAAILLGVPFSLLVLGLTAGNRWRWVALGLIGVAALGIIPLMSTPRFAGLLDPHSGTLFFRLQLWRASWKMFVDHPWLGVGPDNFLYQYRGRYILPSAWQEPHLSHAHNLLLTYATRLGLPGLVVGLSLQAAFWWRSLRPLDVVGDRRALQLGLMGAMAYTVAHGLVDASTFFVDLAIAFLLMLGLVQWNERFHTYEQEH